MARLSPMVLAPPAIFAALAVTFWIGMQREDPDALPSTREGLPAPSIQPVPVGDLPTFSDAELAADGVKIVNFWASWCAPCRAEHPNLLALGAALPVYGVNRDRTPEDARAFLDELGNPFDGVVGDGASRQSIDWGVYALPETFVIDGEGTVVLHFRGPITRRFMERDILPAIEAAGGGPVALPEADPES